MIAVSLSTGDTLLVYLEFCGFTKLLTNQNHDTMSGVGQILITTAHFHTWLIETNYFLYTQYTGRMTSWIITLHLETIYLLLQGLDFVPSRENHIWFSPDSFARINWFSFYDKIHNTAESNCYAN